MILYYSWCTGVFAKICDTVVIFVRRVKNYEAVVCEGWV